MSNTDKLQMEVREDSWNLKISTILTNSTIYLAVIFIAIVMINIIIILKIVKRMLSQERKPRELLFFKYETYLYLQSLRWTPAVWDLPKHIKHNSGFSIWNKEWWCFCLHPTHSIIPVCFVLDCSFFICDGSIHKTVFNGMSYLLSFCFSFLYWASNSIVLYQ